MILKDMHSSMPPSNVKKKKRVFCYQLEKIERLPAHVSTECFGARSFFMQEPAEKSIILQENE